MHYCDWVGELFLESICISWYSLWNPCCSFHLVEGRLISSCRDHPERWDSHGKGGCWPMPRMFQPCWCHVLLQEGLRGSCGGWSHSTVLLWGAAVLESPQQNQCQPASCQLETGSCVGHWHPNSVLPPAAFPVSQTGFAGMVFHGPFYRCEIVYYWLVEEGESGMTFQEDI